MIMTDAVELANGYEALGGTSEVGCFSILLFDSPACMLMQRVMTKSVWTCRQCPGSAASAWAIRRVGGGWKSCRGESSHTTAKSPMTYIVAPTTLSGGQSSGSASRTHQRCGSIACHVP